MFVTSVPTNLTYHPDSPARPPDWRARLIELLPSAPESSRKAVLSMLRSDLPIVYLLMIRFQIYNRFITGLHPVLDPFTGAKKEYGLGATDAESFRASASSWEQAVLTAWLLTGLTDNEIAAKTGLPATTIRWFERLFFHCRDRLSFSSLVMCTLTMYWDEDQTSESLLRQLAYHSGPQGLEFALRYWNLISADSFDRQTVAGFDRKTQDNIRSLWQWYRLRMLPVSRQSSVRDVRELQRMSASMREVRELRRNNVNVPIWSEDELRAEEFRRGAVNSQNGVIRRRRKDAGIAKPAEKRRSA